MASLRCLVHRVVRTKPKSTFFRCCSSSPPSRKLSDNCLRQGIERIVGIDAAVPNGDSEAPTLAPCMRYVCLVFTVSRSFLTTFGSVERRTSTSLRRLDGLFCQVAFQISDDEKEDCAVDWYDDIADFLNFNNFFESSEVSSIQFVAMRIRVDSEPWDICVQLLELMMTEMWTRFSLQLSLVEKIVLRTS